MRHFMLLVVCVLTIPATLLRAQTLADRVPDDAIVYVGWAGAGNMGPGFEGSHLQAVLKASDWNDFFDRFLPMAMKKIGQSDRDAADATQFFGAIAKPMWSHPSAFYFGGVDFPADGGPPMPRLAIYCDAGADAPALERAAKDLIAKAPRQPDHPPVTVSNVEGLVTIVLGRLPAEAKSLAASESFKASLANVHKAPVMTFYVDNDRLMSTVDAAIASNPESREAEQWPTIRDALGLNGMKRAIATGGFDGKEWGNAAFVEAPAPRLGLMQLLEAKPLSPDIVKSIPATATSGGAGRFDFSKLLASVQDGGSKIDPAFEENYGAVMGMLGGMVGVEVRDLLEPLGDEWSWYIDPTVGGNSTLGMTIVNKLDDPAKAMDLLTKAEQGINRTLARQLKQQKMTVQFKTITRGDLNVHYLALPILTPAWAIDGDKWYFGFNPQTVISAVADAKKPGRKTILDNPAYATMRAKLGDQAAGAIKFVDVPRLAPDNYATWVAVTRLAGFGDLFGVDSPAVLLPPLFELSQHLTPAGAMAWSDDKGFYVRTTEAFPGSEVLGTDPTSSVFPQQVLVASILFPSLNRARETANRVKSASNLRQIGIAMLLFSNENKQKLPDSFGQMITTQDIGVEVFANPRLGTSVPPDVLAANADAKGDWADENSDYVYLGQGKTANAGPEEVMAYENPDGLDDGINILFGDGHVEFVQMEDAMRMIGK